MSKRVIALVMVASLSSTTLVEAAEIKKDESVFVSLNANGGLEKTTVSNWIHSDESDLTIKDKTELSDVKNVKGDTEPDQSGQVLTWQMDGSNLYYQGTLKKPLPIGVKIKYYLDGEEIEAEDLSGKSGKVKIEVALENKEYKDVDINGKQRRIYTPFTTATIVNLPVDKFSNVTTDGGNMISEGNNNIVSFVAAPGLTESLGVDSLGIDFKLKDTMTIEADVENFSLKPIMVTASPNLLNLDELNNIDENTKISDLKEKLDALKDNMNLLVDGTGRLRSGINAAKPKLDNALSEMNSPSMQEKMSLITEDNKVSGARTLINDALDAKDIKTNEVSGLLNEVNGVNIDDIKEKVNKINSYTNNSDLDLNKAREYMDTINKFMPNADSYLNGADILSKDAQLFAGKEATLNLLYNTAMDLNKDENFNKLMSNIENVDLNKLVVTFNEVDSKISPILKVVTPENLTMAKALLKDAKNVKPYSTKVQKVISEAINNTPGNSVDEKTNNFIAQLSEMCTEVNKIANLDVTEINKKMQLINNILETMPSDFENYSEAYLTLKGYLGYSLQNGTLDTEKAKLVKIISGVYVNDEKLKNKLVGYINSFDASKFLESALNEDEAKLKTYENLFPEINNMLPEINSTISMLPKVQSFAKLAGAMAPSPEEIGNLKILFSDLQKNTEKINEVSNLIENTSKEDLEYLSHIMDSAKNYVSILNENKKYVEDIKKLSIAFNDKKLMNSIEKVKNDLDSTNALGLAKTMSKELPTLQNKLPGAKHDISQAEKMLTDMEKDLPEAKGMLKNLQGKLATIDNAKKLTMIETSNKLLAMQRDLQDNEDILRITQDALQSGNVERARNLINSIPESKGKIQELIDGINKLDEGANRYKNEGIDVLYDKGNEATNSLEDISLAKDELVKASDEYGTFSGKSDDMIGTTKFIMKTAEIEEAEPEEPEVKEVKQEKKGFFAWLKSLFFN